MNAVIILICIAAGAALVAALLLLAAARGKAHAGESKESRAKPVKAERGGSGGNNKGGRGGAKPASRSAAPRSGKRKGTTPKKKSQPPKGKAADVKAVEKKVTKTKKEPAATPEKSNAEQTAEYRKKFPEKFPFWARLKFAKRRTTLVIDKDKAWDKEHHLYVDGFVHREATHTKKENEYEEISPNPDKDDPEPMYLKRPRKHPQRLFEPHNKNLTIPDELQKRYDKNNHKDEDKKE